MSVAVPYGTGVVADLKAGVAVVVEEHAAGRPARRAGAWEAETDERVGTVEHAPVLATTDSPVPSGLQPGMAAFVVVHEAPASVVARRKITRWLSLSHGPRCRWQSPTSGPGRWQTPCRRGGLGELGINGIPGAAAVGGPIVARAESEPQLRASQPEEPSNKRAPTTRDRSPLDLTPVGGGSVAPSRSCRRRSRPNNGGSGHAPGGEIKPADVPAGEGDGLRHARRELWGRFVGRPRWP